jgi:uncharacterized protein YlxP (DUF503 family)
MIVGLLRVELHVPHAQSLKDKRAVVKRLREQVRSHFNVAVAEVEANDTWQRATVGISAIGDERQHVEGLLRQVTEWLRGNGLAHLSRIEDVYLSP